MGANNSRRISHDVDNKQNLYRDDQMRQILDDLDEETSGKGYSEIIRTGPFVSKIILWADTTQDRKRYVLTFTRNGAFVSSVLKEIYSEDGTYIISTLTINITRDTANRALYANAVTNRTA